MYYPSIIFINPSKTSIYLRNFLSWTETNPKIQKNFNGIIFSDLTKQLEEILSPLKSEWHKVESLVMSSISNLTGIPWDEEKNPVIYVYPIPFFNSFSHPLFLRICDVTDGIIKPREVGLNMGMLIHEIIHNNMKGLPINRETNELLINFITLDILGQISIDYRQNYEDFHKKISKPIDLSLIPKEIQSRKKTISDFYAAQ